MWRYVLETRKKEREEKKRVRARERGHQSNIQPQDFKHGAQLESYTKQLVYINAAILLTHQVYTPERYHSNQSFPFLAGLSVYGKGMRGAVATHSIAASPAVFRRLG